MSAFLTSCFQIDEKNDPPDSDDTNPSTDDSDSTPDIDSDTYTAPVECPMNTGFPCACDRNTEICEDGSVCAFVSPETEYGFCARPCNGPEDHASCSDAKGYGVMGYCGATLETRLQNHCIVICLHGENSGPCPVELTCQQQASSDTQICLPAM